MLRVTPAEEETQTTCKAPAKWEQHFASHVPRRKAPHAGFTLLCFNCIAPSRAVTLTTQTDRAVNHGAIYCNSNAVILRISHGGCSSLCWEPLGCLPRENHVCGTSTGAVWGGAHLSCADNRSCSPCLGPPCGWFSQLGQVHSAEGADKKEAYKKTSPHLIMLYFCSCISSQ